MTGMSWVLFGTGSSLVIVAAVSIVLFGYIWLRTHGGTTMTQAKADGMAGDEGEDW